MFETKTIKMKISKDTDILKVACELRKIEGFVGMAFSHKGA